MIVLDNFHDDLQGLQAEGAKARREAGRRKGSKEMTPEQPPFDDPNAFPTRLPRLHSVPANTLSEQYLLDQVQKERVSA